ncbi:MAG: HD-GYP domain-containing protein [Thermodesulfobacteriota bacterium]
MSGREDRFKKIPTKDLKVGMFVEDVGRSWLRHPWLKKKKLVTDQETVKELLEYGISEVVIDLARSVTLAQIGREVEPARPPADEVETGAQSRGPAGIEELERRKTPRPETPGEPVHVLDEMPQARQAYRRALDVTREFITEARAGRKVEVEKAQETVEQMIDSVFRNRGALLALTNLRKYDEYTFTHSLNVSVLAVSMGRHLDLRRSDLRRLGLGAMFHDLGKTGIPNAILNKPGPLTEEEFEIIKKHPVIGAQIMERHQGVSPYMVDMVRHHHERLDGSGYPDGLSGGQLEPHVLISGLSDIYDALSSDRAYHKGLPPHQALRVLFTLRDKQFPANLLDRFIQSLGIYPAGTTIRLNTGEIGVVFAVNHGSLLRPQIILVLDSDGDPVISNKLMNLNAKQFADREIAEVVDPENFDVDPARYFLKDEFEG